VLLNFVGFLFFVIVRTFFLDGMPLTTMLPIVLAYLHLIKAFLYLGLMTLSRMQLCHLRKVSLSMLSLLACHLYKKRNKLGPRTESWGIHAPDCTGILFDDSPVITTDWLRSERKVLIHSQVFPRMP
jgi:hypothetical protein